ncbi:phosphoribosylformylglycinamidine cyclo-ligase [Fodinicola acaciae]|uniref:phosphoribosylformylglycinamidine cyclo-ligase n=1 Tax=Fodinicola acaciae TaxID=2681555 RepID=UPI0013D5B300|nr:phosphoribosylformylglycinamidine cyclo-ligase [Fodinicola acaciae]
MTASEDGATYAASGVDIDAGERAVELMKSAVKTTHRPEVVGDLGGFAGLFAFDTSKYRKPLLASSTDGVGTKLAIAQKTGIHDTVGIDLVAMVTDDLVACGAEPLFLQDYIACGKVVPERIAAIVAGIAEGCRQAGCSLVGGETAEHGGVMPPDEYDLAATAVGVVEADGVLTPDSVKAGDVVIAMGSSGLHSNGFSMVRHVLLAMGQLPLDKPVDDYDDDRALGEILLTPTRIYTRDCLELIAETDVRVLAHVTGGGFAGNLVRVLPSNVDAVIDRSSWQVPPIFQLIAARGRVEREEMERTFNMGVGMVAVVSAAEADRALALLTARHVPSWICGQIVAGTGEARLVSAYA